MKDFCRWILLKKCDGRLHMDWTAFECQGLECVSRPLLCTRCAFGISEKLKPKLVYLCKLCKIAESMQDFEPSSTEEFKHEYDNP